MSKTPDKSSALEQFRLRREARLAGNTNDLEGLEFADSQGLFVNADSIVKLPSHEVVGGVSTASVIGRPTLIRQNNVAEPVVHFVFVADPVTDEDCDDLDKGISQPHELGVQFGHNPYQLTRVVGDKMHPPYSFQRACDSIGFPAVVNKAGQWISQGLVDIAGDDAPLYDIDIVTTPPNDKGKVYINIQSISPYNTTT